MLKHFEITFNVELRNGKSVSILIENAHHIHIDDYKFVFVNTYTGQICEYYLINIPNTQDAIKISNINIKEIEL